MARIVDIIFALIGFLTELLIALAVHIGGFIAVLLTKMLIAIERKRELKYWNFSGDNLIK